MAQRRIRIKDEGMEVNVEGRIYRPAAVAINGGQILDAGEETEQERTTAEALHEIADMPGEDSYGFYVRVVRQGDVCGGRLGWAVGRCNDLLELHFAKGWIRFYRDEDVKRQSDE